MEKIIIITAPSGSGKTTIVKRVLERFPEVCFSVSACTRSPRGSEIDGKDYHFISVEAFEKKIAEEAFVEWEMVYPGKYYGTLKSELSRIWGEEKVPLFDIDVHGALYVEKRYTQNALSIFIQAPSIEELRRRLESRGTDAADVIKERVFKASDEMRLAGEFDHIVVNDTLEDAVADTFRLIEDFIKN